MCNEEYKIQSFIDGEYDGNEIKLLSHIKSCDKCSKTYERLMKEEELVSGALGQMMKTPPASIIDKKLKRDKFKWRLEMKNMKNMRRFASAAAVLAVVGSVVFIDPIKAGAEDILKLFRVEKVQGIAFNESDLRELDRVFEQGSGFKDIENFGSVEVDAPEKNVVELDNPTYEEIKAKFPEYKIVKAPQGYEYWQFDTQPKMDVKMKLDVKTINEFLSFMGEENMLPENLDQKEFKIKLSNGYGYSFNSREDGEYKNFSVIQFNTPEIELPKEVDVKEVIRSLKGMKFIPDDVKKQIASIDDLDTLPVPYYEKEQNMEKRTIAGMDATIITQKDTADYDYDYATIILRKDDDIIIVNTNMEIEEAEKLLNEME